MDVQQKIQSIQAAIDTINQKFSDIALRRAAITMRNSIEKRVHEKSKRADGAHLANIQKQTPSILF